MTDRTPQVQDSERGSPMWTDGHRVMLGPRRKGTQWELEIRWNPKADYTTVRSFASWTEAHEDFCEQIAVWNDPDGPVPGGEADAN